MRQGKHSLIYFLGRGLPGLINFAALSIYTRLIVPQEYGKYALVSATVSLLNMVLFQWIRLSLLRFLPKAKTEDDRRRLYSAIALGFLMSCLISSLLGIGYYFIWLPDPVLVKLLIFGLALLLMEAFFELNLEYFRSNLKPKLYSITFIVKSLVVVIVSSLLAWLHFGAVGLIEGIIIADIVALIVFFREFIKELIFNIKRLDSKYFYMLLRYGLPLTLSFAMTFIINSSDRYFISYYLNEAATGRYSVGYDLSRQSLWVIMMSINLGSFPLAVRALEKGGIEDAYKQLEANLILLLGISTPAAIGMAVLSDKIAGIFVGKLYIEEVALIIPFISIGALIAGLKNFYIDQSFQLGNKTYLQIWSVIAAAVVNILLNILWIPKLGVMGAIYSTVICFLIALIISLILSKRSFAMPLPWIKIIKISFSAILMGVAILLLKKYVSGIFGLVTMVVVGAIIYLLLLIISKIVSLSLLKEIKIKVLK